MARPRTRHDSVTRVDGSFRSTLATIRALRAAGVNCRVGTVLMKANDGEFEAVLNLARELGVRSSPGRTCFRVPTVEQTL